MWGMFENLVSELSIGETIGNTIGALSAVLLMAIRSYEIQKKGPMREAPKPKQNGNF